MVPIDTALIIDFPFVDVYRLVWTVPRLRILMYVLVAYCLGLEFQLGL